MKLRSRNKKDVKKSLIKEKALLIQNFQNLKNSLQFHINIITEDNPTKVWLFINNLKELWKINTVD
jgi:hypothetical protein